MCLGYATREVVRFSSSIRGVIRSKLKPGHLDVLACRHAVNYLRNLLEYCLLRGLDAGWVIESWQV